MTSEIEAKRKEDLIVKEAMKQLDYIGVERQRMEDLLYSVIYKSKEMARKEFLDFLENFGNNWNANSDYPSAYLYSDLTMKIRELKGAATA